MNKTFSVGGRLWTQNNISFNGMKKYIGCVSKEDNEKYNLGGSEMMGDDTFIIQFNEEEMLNWKRTKLMDQMLNG